VFGQPPPLLILQWLGHTRSHSNNNVTLTPHLECQQHLIFLQDIDGVDDAANFTEVLEALSDIGLSPADIHALLCTLSGILWLGNLKVEPVHADDSSRIKIDAALSNAASMLGLREKDLAYAITHKKVRAACMRLIAAG
jgi:myosin heavy subunit